MERNILITGITGLIGNYVFKKLATFDGINITGQYISPRNISDYTEVGVKMVRADICDAVQIRNLCQNMNIVIHTAARVLDYGTKDEFYDAHYYATKSLLDDAHRNHVSQFIYISSFGVAASLSRKGKLPNEASALQKSGIIYDDVKIDTEQMVADFCKKHQIHYTIIRPSAVIGEGSVWVVEPLKRINQKPGMFLIDGGKHDACLIDAANLADGIALCIDNPAAYDEIFFFCDDWNITWKQYLNDIAAMKGAKIESSIPFALAYPIATAAEFIFPLMGKKPPIAKKSAKATGSDRRVDCSKARNLLQWKSQIQYKESMDAIQKWVTSNIQ